MQRRRTAAAALIPSAAVIVAVALWRFTGSDAARDLALPLDLAGEGTFTVRLGGPLWRDRTLHDADGAPDVAFVTTDEPLTVEASGRDGARVRAVDVALDGRMLLAHRTCTPPACSSLPRFTVTPPLRRLAAGVHHVDVVARGGPGDEPTRVRLQLTVSHAAPVMREIEPVTTPLSPTVPSAAQRSLRLRSLALLRVARGAGALRALLGNAAVTVAQLGPLRLGAARQGATMLLALPRARARVRATVPLYSPAPHAPAGYVLGYVALRAGPLRDLLVDFDLTTGRVIGIEPGPASRTRSWKAVAGASARGPAPDASTGPPALVRLSDLGPALLAYDGNPDVGAIGRDWPVSLVFAGHASIAKVKHGLQRLGLTRRGGTHYLAYRADAGSLRFDGDRGLKTPCDAQATDVHVRLYAPSAADRFSDPEFGEVVIATTHLDHADGCGVPPQLYGFSEQAEQRVATLIDRGLGWDVQPDVLDLGNAEPFHRDAGDPGHIWWGDGQATLIRVP